MSQPYKHQDASKKELVDVIPRVEIVRSQPIAQLIERVGAEPPPQCVFRGIFQGNVGAFYGPAKSGKTIVAESLLMHMAAGATEFLNENLYAPHPKVLMVSLEEHYINRTIRNINQIKFITKELDVDPTWIENFHVVNEEFPNYMHSEAEWDALKKEIDRVQPSVVVLDSLTRLCVDPIEESTVALKLMRRLRDLAHSYGITLIIIHHAHKMDDRPLAMSNMAGSRVIAQELDFMMGVNRLSNGTRYIKDIVYRYGSDDYDKVLTFKINDHQVVEAGDFRTEGELLKNVAPKVFTDNDTIVMRFFMDSTQNDSAVMIPTAKLMNQFVDSSVMSRPTLHACLRRLEEKSVVCKVAQGEYQLCPPK